MRETEAVALAHPLDLIRREGENEGLTAATNLGTVPGIRIRQAKVIAMESRTSWLFRAGRACARPTRSVRNQERRLRRWNRRIDDHVDAAEGNRRKRACGGNRNGTKIARAAEVNPGYDQRGWTVCHNDEDVRNGKQERRDWTKRAFSAALDGFPRGSAVKLHFDALAMPKNLESAIVPIHQRVQSSESPSCSNHVLSGPMPGACVITYISSTPTGLSAVDDHPIYLLRPQECTGLVATSDFGTRWPNGIPIVRRCRFALHPMLNPDSLMSDILH
ncbi:hypothetical protein I7I51_05745 [Histoplasma capsulatum]|uniref:Uncharacterized protein n=1 Tax=Ajellomyces capsulatus TaxID=5037 RepID=A0A8A1M4I5_AJECA|nr:hypothetical protein I7I51_05745 [Histoplasma capsulatum]